MKASELTTIVPFGRTSLRFAFRPAGFMATSTSGSSPGVRISKSAICTWKEDTPASVPAGARISAGKLGNVARSFPNAADASVNRVPANCIPSPESPAKRMMTFSTSSLTEGVSSRVAVSSDTDITSFFMTVGVVGPGNHPGPSGQPGGRIIG